MLRTSFRLLGPLLALAALAACGASRTDGLGVTSAQPGVAAPACFRAGEACRWDNQCCSGRCYVETGCAG